MDEKGLEGSTPKRGKVEKFRVPRPSIIGPPVNGTPQNIIGTYFDPAKSLFLYITGRITDTWQNEFSLVVE